MAAYVIRLARVAEKSMLRLPDEMKARLATAIDGLSKKPRPTGVKKLHGDDGLYRIRVGDYRIIYTINDQELQVLVVRVEHRSSVYR